MRCGHRRACTSYKKSFNIFSGCTGSKTCTFLLRGGADQFIEEVERSLHDAIMIVRRAIKNQAVVAGGGATEMELSRYAAGTSSTHTGTCVSAPSC